MLTAWTMEELRRRIAAGAGTDMLARERLMPRDPEGNATRPVDAPAGATPRRGAVLVLLYPHQGDLHLPLTVRTARLRHHSGEVSLPGGAADPEDASLRQTALREAAEELGVRPDTVEIVGDLTPVWIPVSNFHITPFVGYAPRRPRLTPEPREVALVLEVALGTLMTPDVVQSEVRVLRGRPVTVPFFAVADHKVWGATALILATLIGRLDSGFAAPDQDTNGRRAP